eukprot:CAMPEP_0206020512 /NCGR_PEP_ID=MMETSP1464-20131121/31185_1 /ASSEMBLY_ACC=CAM_ASM_001124 /TAXON_ID=119497 /ORGANISM="Exanthemachrysis gayraliae, Strain RCC1523" /LENGTH=103 /DNA_ID=CAMNT_0053394447 /DNA_START=89 /DNA_END=398 /DNA_ORIENTATION=-
MSVTPPCQRPGERPKTTRACGPAQTSWLDGICLGLGLRVSVLPRGLLWTAPGPYRVRVAVERQGHPLVLRKGVLHEVHHVQQLEEHSREHPDQGQGYAQAGLG